MTPHGSASTYTNHGCRCGPCRHAWAVLQRRMRADRLARRDTTTLPHGRYTTYTNWGCRCDDCRAANAAASRRQRAKADA